MTASYAEVIGDPIAHSKSPLIHKFWLGKLGIDADYRSVRVRPTELAEYIASRVADPSWRGCNVTIPHKLAVMEYVADPGAVRQSIGAMNTITRGSDGAFIGTNTDAAGFFAPIAALNLQGARVAVIGNGGAAHAVLFALARCGVSDVTMVVRNPLKGAALLSRFGLNGRAQTLDVSLPPVSLLVNASSLGMTGQPSLAIDISPLPRDALVYDLVYAPLRTALLVQAEECHLDTVDGLEMLIAQAAIAFELFFDAQPLRAFDDELRALLIAC